MELLLLCFIAFAAGWMDAIAGGGAMLQLPALFVLLPQTTAATIIGINKFSSVSGQLGAAIQYIRRLPMQWRIVLLLSLTTVLFAWLGTVVMVALPDRLLRLLILIALVCVTLFTLLRKNFGTVHQLPYGPLRLTIIPLTLGVFFGFQDALVPVGSSTILILLLVSFVGFDFLNATATAKVVNVASNITALTYLASTNHILYGVAIPMAICNLAGSVLGARMAMARGSRFVRLLFLLVVNLIILKFAYDIFIAQL